MERLLPTGAPRVRRALALIAVAAFTLGAVIAAAPFLVTAERLHADEASRREETMGPGITVAKGLVAAPIGGAVAVGASWKNSCAVPTSRTTGQGGSERRNVLP